MVDFNSLLARKYAIQQQDADARTTGANAEALAAQGHAAYYGALGALNQQQAKYYGPEAQAKIAQTYAGANQANAAGALSQANAGMVDPLAQSEIAYRRALGQTNLAQTQSAFGAAPASGMLYATPDGGYAAPGGQTQYRQPTSGGGMAPTSAPDWSTWSGSNNFTDLTKPKIPGFAEGTSFVGGAFGRINDALSDTPTQAAPVGGAPAPMQGGIGLQPSPRYAPQPGAPAMRDRGFAIIDKTGAPKSYAKGTAKVPGKGSSKVDSVPAKLAPDEAVLNAGAADHMGRPMIDALNALGAAKMGMPAGGAQAPQGGAPGYAKGTSKVTKKGGGMPPSGTTPDLSQVDPRLLAAALQMGQGGAASPLQGAPQGGGMM